MFGRNANTSFQDRLSLFSNQPSPQHIQSCLRRPPPNQLPIPRQNKSLMFSVRIVGERDEDQTDGLFFGASVGAGDSRDGQSKISLSAMTDAARHVARHLLTDGAEFA